MQTSVSEARDSINVLVKMHLAQHIPAETIKVTVWPDSLARLPTDASFDYKQGRVGLKIQKSATGALIIRATSDSLQRQHEYYQQSVTVSKLRADSLKNYSSVQQTHTRSGLFDAEKMILCFIAVGTLLTVISYIKNKIKTWQ